MNEYDKSTDTQHHLPTSKQGRVSPILGHSQLYRLLHINLKAHIAEEVMAPLSEVTQVRFDKATDQQLAAYAKKRGIRKSTLLRSHSP